MNQPIWKIWVKMGIFPKFRGENSKNVWVATNLKEIYQDDYNPLAYHQVDPQLVVQPWWPYSKCHDGTGGHHDGGVHVARHPSHIFSQPFQGSNRIASYQFFVTLPETNIFAPENGWLEYDRFLLGRPIFRCENVSFREGIRKKGSIKIDILPKFFPRVFPLKKITEKKPTGKACLSSNHHFSGEKLAVKLRGSKRMTVDAYRNFRDERIFVLKLRLNNTKRNLWEFWTITKLLEIQQLGVFPIKKYESGRFYQPAFGLMLGGSSKHLRWWENVILDTQNRL